MLAVLTDTQGQAQVDLTLRLRAGQGSNVVEATAAGFEGKAVFSATGLPGAATYLHHDAGHNQAGIAGQPLPFPLVVAATDVGHNRLSGVPVTFTVEEGGGNFGGQPSVVVLTDAEGFARATFTPARSRAWRVTRCSLIRPATRARRCGSAPRRRSLAIGSRLSN